MKEKDLRCCHWGFRGGELGSCWKNENDFVFFVFTCFHLGYRHLNSLDVSSCLRQSPVTLQVALTWPLLTPLTRPPSSLSVLGLTAPSSAFSLLFFKHAQLLPSSERCRISSAPDILLPSLFERQVHSGVSGRSLNATSQGSHLNWLYPTALLVFFEHSSPPEVMCTCISLLVPRRKETASFRKTGFISSIHHCIPSPLKGCILFFLSVLL